MKDLIPVERIAQKIYLIRGQKVMLDSDLAELYGVKTAALNQAVKRNLKRFPGNYMFQLTRDEYNSLRSQIVTLEKSGRGKYAKYQPHAFTEHGVVMLSSVLKSQRAIQVSLMVVEVFVKLRQMLSTNTELAHKIEQLERKIEKHDEEITAIFEAIRQILRPPEEQRQKQIGFRP